METTRKRKQRAVASATRREATLRITSPLRHDLDALVLRVRRLEGFVRRHNRNDPDFYA